MVRAEGEIRKRYWVVLSFLVLAGLGNLIGGTDTPGRAAVDPAGGSGVVREDVPVAPRFDATMYVSASSLNLREAPSTGGRVLTSLPRNTKVLAGERRSGWVLVSAQGQVGSVSIILLALRAPANSVPAQNQPAYAVVQRPNAASCPWRQVLHPDRIVRGGAVVPGQSRRREDGGGMVAAKPFVGGAMFVKDDPTIRHVGTNRCTRALQFHSARGTSDLGQRNEPLC